MKISEAIIYTFKRINWKLTFQSWSLSYDLYECRYLVGIYSRCSSQNPPFGLLSGGTPWPNSWFRKLRKYFWMHLGKKKGGQVPEEGLWCISFMNTCTAMHNTHLNILQPQKANCKLNYACTIYTNAFSGSKVHTKSNDYDINPVENHCRVM